VSSFLPPSGAISVNELELAEELGSVDLLDILLPICTSPKRNVERFNVPAAMLTEKSRRF